MQVIEPWNVEHSRIAYEDRWIRVRADRCRRADGYLIDPYYVLEASEWVSVLALTTELEVILVKEYRHGGQIIANGLPGGGALPGEDPSVAARRELLEETGYEAAEFVSLGAAFANWGSQNNKVHYYLALGCRPTQQQSLDENEEIEVVFEALETVSKPHYLAQSFHLANLFLAMPHLKALHL